MSTSNPSAPPSPTLSESSIHIPCKLKDTEIILTSPGSGSDFAVGHTRSYWYLSHTSRHGWGKAKNILLKWQTLNDSGPTPSGASQRLEVLFRGDKVTTEDLGSKWEVLGKGVFGALEDWMIETKWGIEDSSGEVRADWRPYYLVLYFPPEDKRGEGVDLLVSKPGPVSRGLVTNVEKALAKLSPGKWPMVPVLFEENIEIPTEVFGDDIDRPQVWNNPDIYGPEESHRKCVVQ